VVSKGGMSTRLVNVDRNTPMLLPPDMREWVAQDDLAHFVLEAVESLDCSCAAVNVRGSGSAQYPPAMMLGVLIYCYATGTFSSRRIERATYQNLSVRYLSGDTHPDHDTIATFRRENGVLIQRAFVEVLALAQAMGMLRMGTICLDGTKMRAATSKRATWRAQEIEQELARLKAEAQSRLAAAERADATVEPDEQRLPRALAAREQRRAKLEAARRLLEERVQQRAAQRQAERAEDGDGPGEPPRSLPTTPRPEDAINTTDADSGLMPTPREGFVQGYNAQLAVSVEGGLIVAARVSNQTNDRRQLAPTVAALPASLGVPGAILVDTGYDNQRQIAHVEQRLGTLVYCPPQESQRPRRTGRLSRAQQRTQQARARMRQRLESVAGRALYRLRGQVVEPAFGIIKSALGFRGFRLRGLKAVNLEWQLMALAFNCKRLATVSAGS
jgi:transposase